LRETITLLPEQHALRLLSTRKRPESILFSGLVMAKGRETRWLSACWQWALRRSGLVLEELAQRHRYTLETDSPDAMAAWKHWRESRERLAALWVRGPDREHRDFYQATLQEASRDQQEAEVDLARVSARFREQIKTREITIKDVSNTLPRESALVQYVRVRIRAPGEEEGELHYIALVLAREKGNASFVDLGSASAIDHLVEEWRQSLWRTFTTRTSILPPPSNPVTQSGQRLREAIWDPVAAKIGRLRLIFIIPDGSLHQVTLAGLPAQQGGYLVEHQPAFHLLSTGRDLVRLRDEETHPPSAKGLLALGNPDYDADNQVRSKELENTESTGTYRGRTTACAAMLQQHWDRLPESGREVEAIGSFFQDGEPVLVLTDAAATEERFKQEAPGKRILHLATHGFFLQGPCLSAEDPGGAGPTTRPIGENPLLLSGLVLAGANSKRAAGSEGEDGILTAEELAALDLRGVEIVALSACDTGRGSVEAGEGVFGLRRALEIAGARTVLTSLWPVPDNEARDWMEAFYRSKLGGASVLESSRNASLRVLDALRQSGAPTHPYLWAGFVAAGGWE
jgi:CHAT domain-containing protein